jgi:hypothetical protein
MLSMNLQLLPLEFYDFQKWLFGVVILIELGMC